MEYLDSTERTLFRVRTRITRHNSDGSVRKVNEWGGSAREFRKVERATEYAEGLKRRLERSGVTDNSYAVVEYEIQQQIVRRYLDWTPLTSS